VSCEQTLIYQGGNASTLFARPGGAPAAAAAAPRAARWLPTRARRSRAARARARPPNAAAVAPAAAPAASAAALRLIKAGVRLRPVAQRQDERPPRLLNTTHARTSLKFTRRLRAGSWGRRRAWPSSPAPTRASALFHAAHARRPAQPAAASAPHARAGTSAAAAAAPSAATAAAGRGTTPARASCARAPCSQLLASRARENTGPDAGNCARDHTRLSQASSSVCVGQGRPGLGCAAAHDARAGFGARREQAASIQAGAHGVERGALGLAQVHEHAGQRRAAVRVRQQALRAPNNSVLLLCGL